MGRGGFLAGGMLLGAGLAACFDLFLFHGVLQWHHLASSRLDDPAANLRLDGAFGLAMTALALVGLALVWRGRRHPEATSPALAGALLVGAGAFHLADGLVSHLLFGLHRVHPEEPMLWEVAILASGALLAALGAWLLRRRGRGADLTTL